MIFRIQQEYKINKAITAPELRVVGENGENLGVLSLQEALDKAASAGVDLILIVAGANPPVARIMSFDKFRYIKDKEIKRQMIAKKTPEQKQVQISAREAENDLKTKAKRVAKFLNAGHRVEILLRLRGREKAPSMRDWVRSRLELFAKMLDFPYKVVQDIKFDNRAFSMKIDPVETSEK